MFNDQLVFDIGNICRLMKETSATKWNAVSLATRFFDPLGVISPCNASQRAYVAVVYLQVKSEAGIYTQFLCSKTRVAHVKKLTIPRLKLLSALLLVRLVNTTRSALEHEINLGDSICYTDSQVALYWILGSGNSLCKIECSRLENSSQLQVGDIAVDLRILPTFLQEVSLPLNFKRRWIC